MAFSRFPQVFVVFCALLATASACSEAGNTGSGGSSGEIKLGVTVPGDKQIVHGTIQVEGTIKPTAGVKGVELVATAKSLELGKATGGTFTFAWDTTALDAKGNPLFKDGNQCVALTATATTGETANITRCVVVDNTLPQITVDSPKDGDVFIQTIPVAGSISDKNLVEAGVYVDGTRVVGWCDKKLPAADPASCASCAKQYKQCLSGSGTFTFDLDYAGQPSKKVGVQFCGIDANGGQHCEDRSVQVLRAPQFETYRCTAFAATGTLAALETADVDLDGVLDAVMASDKGVFWARGHNIGDKEDPSKAKGDATFEEPVQLTDQPAKLLAQVDIDLDGTMDHVAVGANLSGGWAAAFLSRGGGPRLLETVTFQGTPTAIAAGDVTNDNVDDIVIGGLEDTNALTVLPLLTTALCPTKDAPARACADAKDAGTIGSAQVFAKATTQQLVGDVASIAIADFVEDGSSAGWADIAVGRGSQAVLSVCRNSGGVFEACFDTQSSGYVSDLKDTSAVLAADWNGDGSTDLVLGSTGASRIRWLSGNGDGTFDYDPLNYRTFETKFERLSLEPLGPKGELHVAVLAQAREVLLIPLDLKDETHIATCFRGFVIGGSVAAIAPGDADNDGKIDMIAMDSAPQGISVSPGNGDGTFQASEVMKVCGNPDASPFLTNLEVSQFRFEDLTADSRPDLLILSKPGTSRIAQCKAITGPPPLLPALHLVLNANDGTKLSPYGRAAEISPYIGSQKNLSGLTEDLKTAGCGGKMPTAVSLQTGKFSLGAGRDLAIALDVEYTHGIVPDPLVPDSLTKPNIACNAREYYEVANFFGIETKDKDKGQSEPSETCKNFNTVPDAKDKKAQTGYGQGSPWLRTSLIMILAGPNPSEPYGISTGANTRNPVLLSPSYAQSAGRRPVDMIVGRFDDDAFDDVATVMKEAGTPTDVLYLAPRTRIFRGDGNGKLKAQFYTNLDIKQAQQIASDTNIDSAQIEFITGPPQDQDRFFRQDPGTGRAVEEVPVTYRILKSNPILARGGGFCESKLTSIWSLGSDGNLTIVRALGAMKTSPNSKGYSAAQKAEWFALGQLTANDACTDYLFAGASYFGFVAGTSSDFKANEDAKIPTGELNIAAVTAADVNQDGVLDLLVVDATKSRIEFFLGDGNGGYLRYETPIAVSPTGGDIAQADIDGDGCMELAVQGTHGVTVIKNLGCSKP